MTKEKIKNTPELVDFLLDKCVLADSRAKVRKRLEEICDIAVKALEQEPCEDAISRHAVFEQINRWIGSGEYRYTDATCYLTRRIQGIPPVTPIPSGWNRYDDNDPATWPEDGSWGLWQHKNGGMKVLRWKLDALNHFYPDPYMWDIDDAVAWMPLPEPYKAESEVQDADSN